MKARIIYLCAAVFLLTALMCGTALGDALTLPNDITTIAAEAFMNDASITELVVPEGATSIGKRAFSGSGLTAVTLPASLTSIADDAFDGCDIRTVSIPAGCYAYRYAIEKGWIGATDPEDFTYDYAMSGDTPIAVVINSYTGTGTDLILPDEIDGLPVVGFTGGSETSGFSQVRSTLKSIVLPDTVTSIGQYAFYGCSALESITMPDTVTSFGKGAFYNCSSLTNVTFPGSLQSIGDFAFYGCGALSDIDLPNGLIDIGSYAFKGCRSIAEITIPAGIQSFKNETFRGCTSLENIILPEYMESLGYSTFEDCSSLARFVIPKGVEVITGGLFRGSGLKDLTIPSNVRTVNDAFGSTQVTTIRIGSLSQWLSMEFYQSSTITWYDNSRPNMPFSAATSGHEPVDLIIGGQVLKDVVFSEGMGTIPKAAFAYTTIESVTIPATSVKIGNGAFYGCASLKRVTIEEAGQDDPGVQEVGCNTFTKCDALTRIDLPATVGHIQQDAFASCASLKRLTIPNGDCSFDHANGRVFCFDGSDNIVIYAPKDSAVEAELAELWGDDLDKHFAALG